MRDKKRTKCNIMTVYGKKASVLALKYRKDIMARPKIMREFVIVIVLTAPFISAARSGDVALIPLLTTINVVIMHAPKSTMAKNMPKF
jgi:hypothetical protein